MSKYGQLSRSNGHSKWFLQKTLTEHDRSMDHPWMKMVYKQCFTVKQYAAWLARNWALFEGLERLVQPDGLPDVYDKGLLRTAALETDLKQLLGADWRAEAEEMVRASPSTAEYLAQMQEESADVNLLLCHHFLQYNAVLSGGAYLGKMVSEKLCVLPGAPGVAFYAFAGVKTGKEPARVQQYLRSFDKTELSEEERDAMLVVMKRIYTDTEAMMQEVFDLNPAAGVGYASAKEGDEALEPPPPCSEQLTLSLDELHGYDGANGDRILFSLAGELLDASAGFELYGPGGSYALLAGRDVTRCLATMSLDEAELDDLAWEPDNAEEEATLKQWREKLKVKYPVAGTLDRTRPAGPGAADGAAAGGLRQRASPKAAGAAGAGKAKAEAVPADGEKCPISGKVGTCPMTMMGINVKPKAKAKAKTEAKPGDSSGFMAGKSLIAAATEQSSDDTGEWWLSRLCPLHWDDNTMRAFVMVAAMSWLSGIFVGWNLHKIASQP